MLPDSTPTFVPHINPISDELDNRMKITQESGKERWQTLYELGQKKKEEMEIYRQTVQQLKEEEERQFSYRPAIKTCYEGADRGEIS
jgi:ribosomal protein S25